MVRVEGGEGESIFGKSILLQLRVGGGGGGLELCIVTIYESWRKYFK